MLNHSNALEVMYSNISNKFIRITNHFFLLHTEYQHLMNSVGIKRMNTGLGLSVEEFATNNCFFTLDLSPEQCNHSHIHG